MQSKGRVLKGIILFLILVALIMVLIPGTTQAQSEKGPYDTALVFGTIYNMTEDEEIDYLRNYEISISRENFIPRTNETDRDGYYEVWLPPSSQPYTIKVKDTSGETVKSKTVFINSTDPFEFDLEVHLEEDEEEEEDKNLRDYINIIYDFLKRGWVFIVIGFAAIPIIVILMGIVFGGFEKLLSREKAPTEFLVILKRFLMLFIVIFFFAGEFFVIYFLFELPDDLLSVATRVVVATGIIILMFFFLRMLLFVLNRIIIYYRQKLETKEENLIYSRILLILEFIMKYVIILLGFILMLTIILAALGFEDIILLGIGDFFLTKSGFIIMLALLIIVAISIQKFSKSFFTDLRKRPGTKKLSPGMMFILEKTLKVSLYAILAIIAIFTVLSAMGLGELGQTIILMMSVIIGFVISMAATGSIGNALSGLVIYGFKPIEKGDMVTLTVASGSAITGTVVNIDLMFTTLRDLESQEVRIPNNDVLSYNIVNHTKSEDGGFAVVVDASIGYDVPADKVKDLMRKAAMATNGVLKEPKPFVLLTDFHNHAIEYRLRAFIKNAKAMYPIRSAIMNKMQKNFYRDGIEILSPIYEVGRRDEIPDSKTVRDRFVTAVERDEADEDLGDDDGTMKAFAGFATLEAMDVVTGAKPEPEQVEDEGQPPPPPPEHEPEESAEPEMPDEPETPGEPEESAKPVESPSEEKSPKKKKVKKGS